MPVILATWEAKIRRMEVRGQPQPVKFTRLHLQRAKWTGGVTQRVEHLFCKHEALSSNPSSKKKKKDRKKKKNCVVCCLCRQQSNSRGQSEGQCSWELKKGLLAVLWGLHNSTHPVLSPVFPACHLFSAR
jgi:hypothetical protein